MTRPLPTGPAKGDEVVGERTAPGAGSDGDTPPGNLPAPELARSLVQRDGGRRDTISREIEALVRDQGREPLLEPVVDPLLAEATAAIERRGDLEAFRERLAGIFERMDDARLVELLGRTGFSAALSGDAGLRDWTSLLAAFRLTVCGNCDRVHGEQHLDEPLGVFRRCDQLTG